MSTAPLSASSAPSMPISPNSLTSTAQRSGRAYEPANGGWWWFTAAESR
ncbi:hypothetical protein J4732_01375 [Serratia marcescens]|uniref:Uncharacterized protein n=1 Tax=Serratia marcescens TaxID=615 RepID=A0A939SNF1_SERMA|nr:hypothetical protein [Serratia marcescens]